MVKPLAQRMAVAGYRVLIHDRRNCGLSDIAIGGEGSEYEIWAEDLYELLSRLNGLPVIVGGSSSGCRLSLLFALKYPHAVRALLLWRVTGGAFAAQRLTENYYDQYIPRRAKAAWPQCASSITSRAHRSALLKPPNADGHGGADLYRGHGALARSIPSRRAASRDWSERKGFEFDQGADLHHSR